jgi:hypothetical protein
MARIGRRGTMRSHFSCPCGDGLSRVQDTWTLLWFRKMDRRMRIIFLLDLLPEDQKERPRGRDVVGGIYTIPDPISQMGGYRDSVRLREEKKEIETQDENENM